jgi:hypothetical protein
MNKEDLQQFIHAFEDFMKHSKIEDLYYEEGGNLYSMPGNHRDQVKMVIETEIEAKAAALEVTVDYYLQEFM